MPKQLDYQIISCEQVSLHKELETKSLDSIVEALTMRLDKVEPGQDLDAIIWKYLDKKKISKKDREKLYDYYLLMNSKNYFED